MARHLCKHASKHEAMLANEKVVLNMIWAALIRPKTVAKMTKTRDQNTHTHAHVKAQMLKHQRAISKHI